MFNFLPDVLTSLIFYNATYNKDLWVIPSTSSSVEMVPYKFFGKSKFSHIFSEPKKCSFYFPLTYLRLVSTGVVHHPPVGAVVAVPKTELLHKDLVLAIFPSLDDEPLYQLFFTEIHLQPFTCEGLRLGQQGPPSPAGEKAGILRHPAPVRVRGSRDLVVWDQAWHHAQHARAGVLWDMKGRQKNVVNFLDSNQWNLQRCKKWTRRASSLTNGLMSEIIYSAKSVFWVGVFYRE